ncbi:MAG: leucine-rich repeat protein [Clostridiales bacterium]|nr:leucine-rich repeat protein [Clostridiales bacterium]
MKQGKKIFKTITTILAVALFTTICASILFKDNVKADSAEGEGWYYNDGMLLIESDSAFDVEGQNYGWKSYKSSITTINVDESVTEIPEQAFMSYTSLEHVDLPGVTMIGRFAFYKCTSLESVFFETEGIYIEDEAFRYCSALSRIPMENAGHIGSYAFSYCSSLEFLDLHYCDAICNNAFEYCDGLTGVDLADVHEIPDCAFYCCTGLTSMDLTRVNSLGKYAFYGCSSLCTVDLGVDIEKVREATFYGCSSLTEIDLTQVHELGDDCFKDCVSLERVDLSSEIETIPFSAFNNCQSLSDIDLSSVKIIKNGAFSNCFSLTDVDLCSVEHIFSDAFYGCSGLSEVNLENVVEIDDYAFMESGVSTIIISTKLENLGWRVFFDAPLTTVNVIGSKSEISQHIDMWIFHDMTINYSAFDVFFMQDISNIFCEVYGVDKGDTVDMPDDPEMDGMTFIGWYTDPDCKVIFDPNTPITQDLTLYPGWMKSSAEDTVFKGHSLSLEGDIGVKFYVILPSGTSNNAYMEFKVEGISAKQTVSVKNATSATIDGVTYKVFKCGVPAKNMTSVIRAELKDNNEILATNEYTVQEYAKYIIDNQDLYDGILIRLVKDMVNYGSAAQTYFAHKAGKTVAEENLANWILESNDRGVRYFNYSSYCYDPDSQCNLPEGLEFSSVNLSLKSNTIMKMYFTDAYSRKVTYYLNGVELEQQDSDGRTLIQITGIPVHMIREDFEVTVKVEGDDTEYSVTYCPAYYIHDILGMDNDSIEDLKNVMRHLYLYSGTAEGYTGKYNY